MTDTLLREVMSQEVAEGGVGQLRVDIVDEKGNQIPLASLVTLELTLWDEATQTASGASVINSRLAQSVKNANGGVVAEETNDDGDPVTRARITLGPLDNPIITNGNLKERHIARLKWTWAGGAGPGYKEFAFVVRNWLGLP